MTPLRSRGPSWPSLLLLATCILAALAHCTESAAASEQRVVCYYTNWSVYRPGNAKFSPQNINPYLCTHLIYSFGGFTKENTLKPFDKYQDIEKGGYSKFTGLKTYNKNLKCLLAIGGWNEGSARFSSLVASADRRQQFVKNAVKFLRQNHFDGLDLDWEYPAHRDGGKPRDRDNYAQFVQELREEFERESSKTGRPRLLLTMAVPAGVETVRKGYDVRRLNKYLDWFNLLTYDYHSSFEPSVNHHAPLLALEEDDEYNYDAELNIDYSIKYYLNEGADRDKLVLGIPTYGRSYTLLNEEATEIGSPTDGPGEQGDATREKGYLAYYEICESLKEEEGWTVVQPNTKAMGPYAFRGNQWVGYDDEAIARRKGEYVVANGLGGIMFWSIDNDDFRGGCSGKPYPIIEAAKEAMLDGLGLDDNDVVSKVASPHKKPPRSRSRQESSSTLNKVAGRTKDDGSKASGKPDARQPATTTRRRKPTAAAAVTTPRATAAGRTTTPAPPTTPDPGGDFKCEDEGFYPHPRDCKKYFWCLDSGPSNLGVVAHPFSCPSGLVFNKQTDSCDYTRNVVCKTTPAATTTTTSTTTEATTREAAKPAAVTRPSRIITTRTTTTSTTPLPFADDSGEDDDDYEEVPAQPFSETLDEEDPKVIKELIDLIKKVGGIEQLERQLNLDGTTSVKTASGEKRIPTVQPIISKALYNKVLNSASGRSFSQQQNRYNFSTNRTAAAKGAGKEEGAATLQQSSVGNNKYSSVIRNSRPSAQNEGIDQLPNKPKTTVAADDAKQARPQYVNIRRPSKPVTESAEEDEDEDDIVEAIADDEEDEEEDGDAVVVKANAHTSTTSHPQYVNIQRRRGTTLAPAVSAEIDDSEEYTSANRQKYSTLERRKPESQASSETETETTESTLKTANIGGLSYNSIARQRPTPANSGSPAPIGTNDGIVESLDSQTTVPQIKLAILTEKPTTQVYSTVARRTSINTPPTTTSTSTTTAIPTHTATTETPTLTTDYPTPDPQLITDDFNSITTVKPEHLFEDETTSGVSTESTPIDLGHSEHTTVPALLAEAETTPLVGWGISTAGSTASSIRKESATPSATTANATPNRDAEELVTIASSPRPFAFAKRTRRPFGAGPTTKLVATTEPTDESEVSSKVSDFSVLPATATAQSANKPHALGSLLSVRSHALGATTTTTQLGDSLNASAGKPENPPVLRTPPPRPQFRPNSRLAAAEVASDDHDVQPESIVAPKRRTTFITRANRNRSTTEAADTDGVGEESAEQPKSTTKAQPPRRFRPRFEATKAFDSGFETTTKYVERLLRPDIGNDLSSLTAVDFSRAGEVARRPPSRRVWPANRSRSTTVTTAAPLGEESSAETVTTRASTPSLLPRRRVAATPKRRQFGAVAEVSATESAPTASSLFRSQRKQILGQRTSTAASIVPDAEDDESADEESTTVMDSQSAPAQRSYNLLNDSPIFYLRSSNTRSKLSKANEDENTQRFEQKTRFNSIESSRKVIKSEWHNNLDDEQTTVAYDAGETTPAESEEVSFTTITSSSFFRRPTSRTTFSPESSPISESEIDDEQLLTSSTTQRFRRPSFRTTSSPLVEPEDASELISSTEDNLLTAPEEHLESEGDQLKPTIANIHFRRPSLRTTSSPESFTVVESDQTESDDGQYKTTTAKTIFRRPAFRTTSAPESTTVVQSVSEDDQFTTATTSQRFRRPLFRSSTTPTVTVGEDTEDELVKATQETVVQAELADEDVAPTTAKSYIRRPAFRPTIATEVISTEVPSLSNDDIASSSEPNKSAVEIQSQPPKRRRVVVRKRRPIEENVADHHEDSINNDSSKDTTNNDYAKETTLLENIKTTSVDEQQDPELNTVTENKHEESDSNNSADITLVKQTTAQPKPSYGRTRLRTIQNQVTDSIQSLNDDINDLFTPTSTTSRTPVRPYSIRPKFRRPVTETVNHNDDTLSADSSQGSIDDTSDIPRTASTPRSLVKQFSGRTKFRTVRPLTSTSELPTSASTPRSYIRKYNNKFDVPSSVGRLESNEDVNETPLRIPALRKRPLYVSPNRFRNSNANLNRDVVQTNQDDEQEDVDSEEYTDQADDDQGYDNDVQPPILPLIRRPTYKDRFTLNREEPALVVPVIVPSNRFASNSSPTSATKQPPSSAKFTANPIRSPSQRQAATSRKQNTPFAGRFGPTQPAPIASADAHSLLADLDRTALNSRNKAIFEKHAKKHYSNTPLTANPTNNSTINTIGTNNNINTAQIDNINSTTTTTLDDVDESTNPSTTESLTNTLITISTMEDAATGYTPSSIDTNQSTDGGQDLSTDTNNITDDDDDDNADADGDDYQLNAIISTEFQAADDDLSAFSTVADSADADATTDATTTTAYHSLKSLPTTTTTTQKPTTLHHIFAVDYDDQRGSSEAGLAATSSTLATDTNDQTTATSLPAADDVSGTAEPAAELITHKLEKLAEVNRIVEISSQQSHSDPDSEKRLRGAVVIEKPATLETLGEVSRLTLIKLVENQIHDGLRSVERRENRQLVLREQIFNVETSTIPLEALFDQNRVAKQLDLEAVTSTTTTTTSQPNLATVSAPLPKKKPPPTVTTETPSAVHSLAPQLLRSHEANESIPLVISIANLDRVHVTKSTPRAATEGEEEEVVVVEDKTRQPLRPTTPASVHRRPSLSVQKNRRNTTPSPNASSKGDSQTTAHFVRTRGRPTTTTTTTAATLTQFQVPSTNPSKKTYSRDRVRFVSTSTTAKPLTTVSDARRTSHPQFRRRFGYSAVSTTPTTRLSTSYPTRSSSSPSTTTTTLAAPPLVTDQYLESSHQDSKFTRARYNQIGELLTEDLIEAITTISRAPLPAQLLAGIVNERTANEPVALRSTQQFQPFDRTTTQRYPTPPKLPKKSTIKVTPAPPATTTSTRQPTFARTTYTSANPARTTTTLTARITQPSTRRSSTVALAATLRDYLDKTKPQRLNKSLKSKPDEQSSDKFHKSTTTSVVPQSNSTKVKVILHDVGYIECLDQGNFPHPLSCRKFISCAKMEIGGVVGWAYTCPKGLSYDPVGGICNWAAGLGCNE